MPDDCVFCRIVARDAPANIFELDDTTGAALMATVVRVARGVRAVFAPDGVSIWQSNGKAAGQEVFHVHMQVVPRHEDDGLLYVYSSKPGYPERTELNAQADLIRNAVAGEAES